MAASDTQVGEPVITIRESTHTLAKVGIHVMTSLLEVPTEKNIAAARDALDLTQSRVMSQLLDTAPGVNDALADVQPPADGRGATVRYDGRLTVMGVKVRCQVTVISEVAQQELKRALGDRLQYIVEPEVAH